MKNLPSVYVARNLRVRKTQQLLTGQTAGEDKFRTKQVPRSRLFPLLCTQVSKAGQGQLEDSGLGRVFWTWQYHNFKAL